MSISRDKLEELEKYNTASFAVWSADDIKDVSVIGDEYNVLHTKVIILGLNPSVGIEFPHNFHYKEQFDGWYRDAFTADVFRGAYMTDLISYPEANSRTIIKKWKSDESFKERNIKALQEQLETIGREDLTIVCLGKNTYELLLQVNIAVDRVYYVKHPNSYRISKAKEMFINDVKEVAEKIKGHKRSRRIKG